MLQHPETLMRMNWVQKMKEWIIKSPLVVTHVSIPGRKILVHMAKLKGGSSYSPKRTILSIYNVLNAMWMSHKVVGQLFCGRMRPKYNFLAWMSCSMFGNVQTVHSYIWALSHVWNMVVAVSLFGFDASEPRRFAIRSYEIWMVPAISTGKI